MTKTLLTSVTATLLGLATGTQGKCLQYEPAKVTVTGVIGTRVDPGPPYYSEDPAHSSKEKHLYIALDHPICVVPNPNGDLNDVGETNVVKMEMVYWSPLPFQHAWLGKHVSVSGALFHGFDAHHWTAVLITPTETHVLGVGGTSP